MPRYLFAAQFVAGKQVLDVGSGTGYGAARLRAEGAAAVDGLELAADAVTHAVGHHGGDGVAFHRGDATNFQLKRLYQIATCFELIEHVTDQDAVLACIKRHLESGGMLVISTPRPSPEVQNPFHLRELTAEEFRSLLGRHFKYIRLFRQDNISGSCVYEHEPNLPQARAYSMVDWQVGREPDFAIALASDNKHAVQDVTPQFVIMLDDEGYLQRVEQDNRILFKAEKDLQVDIANLRHEETKLTAQHEQVTAELRAALAQERAVRDEFQAFRVRWRWPIRVAIFITGV